MTCFAPRVTLHAHHRYREHHPTAAPADVLAGLQAGEAITAELARALARQPQRPEDPCRYVASSDHRGIFVISPDGAIVTYLRLSNAARAALTPPPPPPPPVVVVESPPLQPGEIWLATGGRFFLVEATWAGAVRLQRVVMRGPARTTASAKRNTGWRFKGCPTGWPIDTPPQKARKFLLQLHSRAEPTPLLSP